MLSKKTTGFIVHSGSTPVPSPQYWVFCTKKMLFWGSGSWASKTAPTWQLSYRLVHTTPSSVMVLVFQSCLHLLQHALYFCGWISILVYIYIHMYTGFLVLGLLIQQLHQHIILQILDEVWPLFGSFVPQSGLKTHKIQ